MSEQLKLKSKLAAVRSLLSSRGKKTAKDGELNRENRILGQMERKLATYQVPVLIVIVINGVQKR